MKFLWTTLTVKNLDESIAFYSDVTDLRLMRRFPAGPGMEIAFMGNGTGNETLVELLRDANNSTPEYGEAISIGFAVESVDAMMEKVRAQNITVPGRVVETPTSRFFIIKDPNGLNVQFFQQK